MDIFINLIPLVTVLLGIMISNKSFVGFTKKQRKEIFANYTLNISSLLLIWLINIRTDKFMLLCGLLFLMLYIFETIRIIRENI